MQVTRLSLRITGFNSEVLLMVAHWPGAEPHNYLTIASNSWGEVEGSGKGRAVLHSVGSVAHEMVSSG